MVRSFTQWQRLGKEQALGRVCDVLFEIPVRYLNEDDKVCNMMYKSEALGNMAEDVNFGIINIWMAFATVNEENEGEPSLRRMCR